MQFDPSLHEVENHEGFIRREYYEEPVTPAVALPYIRTQYTPAAAEVEMYGVTGVITAKLETVFSKNGYPKNAQPYTQTGMVVLSLDRNIGSKEERATTSTIILAMMKAFKKQGFRCTYQNVDSGANLEIHLDNKYQKDPFEGFAAVVHELKEIEAEYHAKRDPLDIAVTLSKQVVEDPAPTRKPRYEDQNPQGGKPERFMELFRKLFPEASHAQQAVVERAMRDHMSGGRKI